MLAAAALAHAQAQTQTPARFTVSADACSVARAVHYLAVAAGVPAGIEVFPGACSAPRPQLPGGRDVMELAALPLPEALDALVALAPAYEWRSDGRVVGFRPRTAWADADHFLQKTITRFVVERVTVEDVLLEVQTMLGPWEFRPPPRTASPTNDLRKRLSLDLRDVSALDVLNALVAAHGRLIWEMSYCGPRPAYELSRIALTTFDRAGVAAHPIFLRGSDGRTFDPCAVDSGDHDGSSRK